MTMIDNPFKKEVVDDSKYRWEKVNYNEDYLMSDQTLQSIVNEFIEKVADFKRANGNKQSPYEINICRPLDPTDQYASLSNKLRVAVKID